ncbi:hydroxyacid dehydrogenase [Brevibacillus fluminis]|uniref:Hydroxyacid dehydrogenase n=1 Tax=Brevibacillus fluminis TaxID=511487 RepID=A0A3M8CW39_9BACL|nr:NAD(P)-dependent oxidoreductase [Brevibacillus fluminis]RNB79571.1 hydroxyacid dehydrogenase [Brevibacillus fluminis]
MSVLLIAPYPEQRRRELEQLLGPVHYYPWTELGRARTGTELLELLQRIDARAVIVELDEVTEEVIADHPLDFIGVCRATPVNVAVQAASKRAIPVFRTIGRNVQAVVELVIGTIITMLRHVRQSETWLKGENWIDQFGPYLQFQGSELHGKKVGVIGLGAVGKRIAKLLEAFSCEIVYYDPYVEQSEVPAYQALPLEDLLAKSDIVTVHLPSLPETHGLLSLTLLAHLQPHALFVNTSRSSVVDNDALYELLSNKQIAGAILDVFDAEPPGPREHALIQLDNVLATPHIAGASHDVYHHHAAIMNEQIIAWLKQSQVETAEPIS